MNNLSESIKMASIYTASDKIVARMIEDELLIVPIEEGIADFDDALYSLNNTGQAIWKLLEQKKSVTAICMDLAQEYDQTVEAIEKDVIDLLNKLLNMGIIVEDKSII